MNKVIEIGRIATDIESKVTQSGISWATFRIAVNRRFKNAEGKHDADFFSVVVWRQTADFVTRYGHKGDRIAVCGTLQTRSYDAQDGTKRYVTEINADEVELFSGGGRGDGTGGANAPADGDSQQDFSEVDDDELPF